VQKGQSGTGKRSRPTSRTSRTSLPFVLAAITVAFVTSNPPLSGRPLARTPIPPSTVNSAPFDPLPASAGELDPSFGNGGKVVTKVGTSSSAIYDLAILPDGKILTVGPSGGFSFVTLARYNVDGSLDSSFGNNGIAAGPGNFVPYMLAVQPDGKIVVAGANTLFFVARYNSNGSPDLSFGSGGQVSTDFFHFNASAFCVALQSDGKILAGGFATEPGFGSWFAITRYNTDGSLDTGFGVGGKSLNNFSDLRAFGIAVQEVDHIAIQSDGKILAVGDALGFPNLYDFVIARYNLDGSLDTSFGSGGKVLTDFAGGGDFATQVVIQPDGKIVVGGRVVFSSPANFDFGLVRYNLDGSLDNTFGTNGKVATDFANNNDRLWALALRKDGRIVAGGETYNPSTGYDFVVAEYNVDGSLNTKFGSGGRVETDFFGKWDFVYGLKIQTDGKIVAGGQASSYAIDAGDGSLVRYLAQAFDTCLQDDSSGYLLEINSVTGEYQFSDCSGVTIGGTGSVSRRGSTLTLQHNAADRRVSARIDLAANKGSASIQILTGGRTFTITDRNIANNNCACGVH
jgi:uncharacterized delta-60 repeat protein